MSRESTSRPAAPPDENQVIASWKEGGGEPVVSVLCHVYNHAPYVEAALAGILRQQTDFPFEVIVRDDASQDGTREIVQAYAGRYRRIIRPVLETENRYSLGVKPLVVTLPLARGEFTAMCEGDDYWTDPRKLQLQVDHLRRHPDAGAVHSDFDRILFRGGRWKIWRGVQQHVRGGVSHGDIFAILLAGNFIQTCTLCIRTNLGRQYLASGLAIDSYPVGDWPLCLYVAAHSKIAYLNRSLAVYRKVSGSAMNAGHAARARTVAAYIPMIEDFAKMFAVDTSTRLRALAPLHRALYSRSILAGDMPLFERSRSWLSISDASYLQPWRRRLLPWLARSTGIRRLLIRVQDMREAASERFRYR